MVPTVEDMERHAKLWGPLPPLVLPPSCTLPNLTVLEVEIVVIVGQLEPDCREAEVGPVPLKHVVAVGGGIGEVGATSSCR